VEKGGGGKINYYDFLGGEGFLKNQKRHLFIRAIGFKYRGIKSSSLQYLERGRRTEIDYLNGYIISQAMKNMGLFRTGGCQHLLQSPLHLRQAHFQAAGIPQGNAQEAGRQPHFLLVFDGNLR